MTATPQQLDFLAARLARSGISAFCPTTLSAPVKDLENAVRTIGEWCHSRQKEFKSRDKNAHPRMAYPAGIHLEGPFLSPNNRGAHPENAVRPLDLEELEHLWKCSRSTIKIITVAPESARNNLALLKKLCAWAKKRKIILSLGHSGASAAESAKLFRLGFGGVTHLWNAMKFHHREPGIFGGLLESPQTYAEIIIDHIHVDRRVIRFTRNLHDRCCFVSDCAPAAELKKSETCSFGHLSIQNDGESCRISKGPYRGTLAGGARLLPKIYSDWIRDEARDLQVSPQTIWKGSIDCLNRYPREALGIPKKFLHPVSWHFTAHGVKISIPD